MEISRSQILDKDVQPHQNKNIMFQNDFKNKLNSILDENSNKDFYTPSNKTSDIAWSDIYSKTNTTYKNTHNDLKLKYYENGIITLSDKYLCFTPYDSNEKSWSKNISNENEYYQAGRKIEAGDKKEVEKEEFWEDILDNVKLSKEEQKSDSDSTIIVNADGSRVLVVTINIGGRKTQMSLELSKPTDLLGDSKEVSEVDNENEIQEDDMISDAE